MNDTSGKRLARREANLHRLATQLTARHIRISIPDGAVRDKLSGPDSYPTELVEREMHCIAVVGAGASAPLLARGNQLANRLEEQFGRDEGELDRLRLVNNLKRNALETRLIALSRSPDAARRVRDTISKHYDVRHPTLLVYELLAHLLKHRFLDAIISFNFDELLDQSLDDELDRSEYIRVVSERDCSKLQADPSAADYVPLYVKLHGTASEPDSLRFTPDSYYSIPQRISRVVQELLHTEHCVIANVGAGLSSFDFQRLLRIPGQLDVFNLSRRPVEVRVSDKISRERDLPKRELRRARKHKRDLRWGWLHECNAWGARSDGLMQKLTDALQHAGAATELPSHAPGAPSGQLVQFRSVARHEAVAVLLGSDALHSSSSKLPELEREGWARTPGRAAPDSPSSIAEAWDAKELQDYARRRTILELAFAGAKARGLLSLVPLVHDRPARYYELFRRGSPAGVSADTWAELCSAAGLEESVEVPDILISREALRAGGPPGAPGPALRETRALHRFDANKLADHVLMRISDTHDPAHELLLATTLRELQERSEVELHIRDDRVCSKAFKRPATLSTATAAHAYRWLILRNLKPQDEVHVSSETGGWLLTEPMRSMLAQQQRIQLLLAFAVNLKDLKAAYGERLETSVIDPWRHNRHMAIVCEGERPKLATYFARRQRSPVITAVYLEGMRDVKRLQDVFRQRWEESVREEREHGHEGPADPKQPGEQP